MIIIVSIVGSMAFVGALWGLYSYMSGRRNRQPAPTTDVTTSERTTMVYIPGEQPGVVAAIPSLRYDAPPVAAQSDIAPEPVSVIMPPPPAYDVATAAPLPDRPKPERAESRWKELWTRRQG
ncbi:hypothetical protein CTheo_4263 [Ceratobasidium theobromae]|uniref:Transmembrane protein n=1 Tax=Ceratobasidium theobromae TaxID=1582974 RepID=A0A5N5QM85_9AGAM|nr:hypothetical protein CTheo_4263 [Ceratobasidium theobromae]